MLAKHRVTYVHPISNPRDAADQIPAAVELLDVDALCAALCKPGPRSAVAALLRHRRVLPSGVRAREVRMEDGRLIVITAVTGLHAVVIDLTPCYDALTSDKNTALVAAHRASEGRIMRVLGLAVRVSEGRA